MGKRKTHCKRGHELTPENVYVVPKSGGRRCAVCQRERNRRHAAANHELVLERKRQLYRARPEYYREISRRYREAHPGKNAETARRWREADPERYREWRRANNRRRRRALRQDVLDIYGRSCAHCGETDESKLAIDHMDENGRQHRAEIGGGGQVTYAWLKKHGFPEGFQTLCRPCNSKKSWAYKRLKKEKDFGDNRVWTLRTHAREGFFGHRGSIP